MEQLGSCGCQNGRVKLESNLILEGGVGGARTKEGRERRAWQFPVRERLENVVSSPLRCAWLCDSPSSGLWGGWAHPQACCSGLLLAPRPLPRPPARAVAVRGSWGSVSGCSHVGPQAVFPRAHEAGFTRLVFAPRAPLLPVCRTLECFTRCLNGLPHQIIIPTLQIGKLRLREVAQGHRADT